MNKLYGLVLMIPDQRAIIEEYCFPLCGRLQVGGMDDPITGPMFACPVPADECPRYDGEMEEPMGEVDGHTVYVRKLRGG